MNPAWIEKTGKVVVCAIGTAFVAGAKKFGPKVIKKLGEIFLKK